LVARFVRDEEAAGSNPVTPTVFPQARGLRADSQRALAAEKYSSRHTEVNGFRPPGRAVSCLEASSEDGGLFALGEEAAGEKRFASTRVPAGSSPK
jgi:hypothetical protein